MPAASDLPRRRSLRLPGFDYGANHTYFVTLVVQDRHCILSQIEAGANVVLTEPGHRVDFWWNALPERFPEVRLGDYVVMPNHLHALISIDEGELPGPATEGGHVGPPLQRPTLSRLIQWFKTMTTNECLRRRGEAGWMPSDRRLWQRNYYEHVVRNERVLGRIHDYIAANPARWGDDPENPTPQVP